MDEKPKRSEAQNKAIHKLFGDIAAHCVGAGIDQKAVTTRLAAYAVPVSPQFVKETWRAMQIALTGKTSTKDLARHEIDQVYDVFNKFWSEMTGEHFAFPTYEALINYDDKQYQ